MDPMTMGAIGAGVSLLARLIGEAIAAGDIDKAEELKRQAVAEYGDGILPQLEQVTAQEVGPTELSRMSVDPTGRNSQVAALERLAAFADSGFSPEDAADQRRVMDEAAGVAARQAGMGERLAASRGLARSGLSQALGQQAAQAGAQNAADAAAQMAAQRRARQLQALGMLGQQGGALRGADYGEASDRATAQDAINRFNANMRASAIDQRNQNALAGFSANMRLKGARNDARQDQAGFYTGRASANKQTAADIGEGFSSAASGAGNYMERQDALSRRYPKGGK